jgi:hypothetical protein
VCTRNALGCDLSLRAAAAQINVPATIMYAASRSNEDPFRKPKTGMWDYFVEHLNGGVVPGGVLLPAMKARAEHE